MDDFTPFHDEIRFVNHDLMVGKYFTVIAAGLLPLFGPNSLGIFHGRPARAAVRSFRLLLLLRRSALTTRRRSASCARCLTCDCQKASG